MTARGHHRWVLLVGAAAIVPLPVAAQAIRNSPRVAGMAGSGTLMARGSEAGLFNPALLAWADNPALSLAVTNLSMEYGTSPVSLGDVRRFGNRVVPEAIKAEWLERIRFRGSQVGSIDGDGVLLGVSFGRVAVNWQTVAAAGVDLPEAAAEILLQGNVDSAGQPRDLGFAEGTLRGWGLSSLGAAVGIATVPVAGGHLAVGATGKVVFGHGFVDAKNLSGAVVADPLSVDFTFPGVVIYRDGSVFSGSGVGLDLGLAWRARDGAWSAGVSVIDLANSFGFPMNDVRVRDARLFITKDATTSTDGDERRLDDPGLTDSIRTAARAVATDATPAPTYRASVAWSGLPRWVFSADLMVPGGRPANLRSIDATRFVGGAEFALARQVRVRGGMGLTGGRFVWSLGAGLSSGGVGLDVAFGRDQTDRGRTRFAIGLGYALH